MSERTDIAEELARYRQRKLWPYFLVVFILAVGGGIFWYVSATREVKVEPTEKLFIVKKMDIPITVEESATLQPKDTIPVTAEIYSGGRLSVQWVIDEGVLVKKGDTLMKLEPKSFLDEQERFQKDIDNYEDQIKKTVKDIELQKIDNDNTTKQSDLDIARVKREFERGMTNIDITIKKKELEVRDKEIAVKDSEIAVEKSRKNLDDTQALYDRGFASKEQLRDAELAWEKDKNTLERNKNAYEVSLKDQKVYLEVEVPQDKEKLQEAINTQQRLREKNEQAGLLRLEKLETELKNIRSWRDDRAKNLTRTMENIEMCNIKSPADGIVVLSEHPFRGKIKVGDNIWPGTKVMEIPSVSDMKAVAPIPEFDIQKVQSNLECEIVPDVRKDRVYRGYVTTKANAGRPDTETGNTVFDVDIILKDKADDFIKPGMGARVTIFIERLQNTIGVPIESVYMDDEESKTFVYLYNKSGDIEKRFIKVGKNNDVFVQVLEGLAVDDKVFIVDPYSDEPMSAADEKKAKSKDKKSAKNEDEEKKEGADKKQKPDGEMPSDMNKRGRSGNMPPGMMDKKGRSGDGQMPPAGMMERRSKGGGEGGGNKSGGEGMGGSRGGGRGGRGGGMPPMGD